MRNPTSPTWGRDEEQCLSPLLELALDEDGVDRDVTTQLLQASCGLRERVQAQVVAKAAGVVAGMATALPALARRAGAELLADPALGRSGLASLRVEPRVADGARVVPGDVLLELAGPPAHLLARERVLLNFLGRLSGVATATRGLVDAVAGTHCQVLHTRKTTPGWRALELYAVACGGGRRHRRGLHDGIMLKEDYFLSARDAGYTDVCRAVVAARSARRELATFELVIEAETMEEAVAAAAAGANVVMLDDFPLQMLATAITALRAVSRPAACPPVIVEVSGGVTLATAAHIAAAGADRVSTGAITHSAPQLDLSMRFV